MGNLLQNRNIAIAVILLIVIGAAVFLLPKKANNVGQPQVLKEVPKMHNVSLTDDGFVPSEITVNAGEAVVWTNNTKEDASLNSDDHPTHKKYPLLNRGTFAPGGTVQVIFNEQGTHTYHDHFNPSKQGSVIVK